MILRKRLFSWLIPLLIIASFFEGLIRGVWALTIEEEKKLGKKVLLEIEKNVEWMRDLTLQVFLDRVGHSLAAQVGQTPFEFKFYLIKASDPNAFAIPGGHIFVTSGLIILA